VLCYSRRQVRIGVIGLGAIGGPVAARLLSSRRAGEQIALAAGSERTVESVRASGLRVEQGGAALAVPAPPVPLLGTRLPPLDGLYDLVLLCTRTDALEAALAPAAPLLSPQGAVVCVQNGLPEERAARLAGSGRTLGAVVGWSSSADGPGHARITSEGRFTLGSFAPEADRALPAAEEVLARAAPVRLTSNLAGARWSKLAINCAMSTLGTVAGLTLGELASRRDARALALRVVSEVVQVAQRKGVRFERVSGLDPSWLADGGDGVRGALLRPARHALVWAAAQPHRRQRSGMLARLEAGRPAGQIDDLNGAVAAAARELGLQAPVNQRLTDLVHAIERGEERIGLHQLARLR
jgi:2-dehydropantoate 2-reductase